MTKHVCHVNKKTTEGMTHETSGEDGVAFRNYFGGIGCICAVPWCYAAADHARDHPPSGDQHDLTVVSGYSTAQILSGILGELGQDITRERIMDAASDLHINQLHILLPGIQLKTSPTDHYPIEQVQLVKCSGE